MSGTSVDPISIASIPAPLNGSSITSHSLAGTGNLTAPNSLRGLFSPSSFTFNDDNNSLAGQALTADVTGNDSTFRPVRPPEQYTGTDGVTYTRHYVLKSGNGQPTFTTFDTALPSSGDE